MGPVSETIPAPPVLPQVLVHRVQPPELGPVTKLLVLVVDPRVEDVNIDPLSVPDGIVEPVQWEESLVHSVEVVGEGGGLGSLRHRLLLDVADLLDLSQLSGTRK